MSIAVSLEYENDLITNGDKLFMEEHLKDAHDALIRKTGPGADFLGWADLPESYDIDEVSRIKKAAEKIKRDSDAFIVIGIGGSYLGAKAVIDAIKSPNYNLLDKDTPDIFFAGNGFDPRETLEIIKLIENRDFSINVISKSGTTTEPAIAFRIFRDILEKKYGRDEAKNRIYVTTDRRSGALRKMSDSAGFETFSIPCDIGGRYSVLTAVGLLPMCVAGIDIDALIRGAAEEREELISAKGTDLNSAWKYASARNILYKKGFDKEILCTYNMSMRYFGEWWKQLFGESEGKGHKGIFPASCVFTADLHSMGQYIQDGQRDIIETTVNFNTSKYDFAVPAREGDEDSLAYLSGKTLSYINEKVMRAAIGAHVEGGVPNIVITAPACDEKNIGALIYFFEFSCGLSGYVLGVNPFDQPGVEKYKNNMFELLGKPGYQKK